MRPHGHVIVIDDDASVRRSLSTMLERVGYEVSLYDCADTFLENPVVPKPAVIVLDMRMPGTTGIGLQSQLKTLAQSVPVVFVSGDSRPEEIIEAMKQGAVDFLLKPFTAQSMMDVIQRAMNMSHQAVVDEDKNLKVSERLQRLTPREMEVCHWMVRGYSNQQIATIDGGASATIKLHRARVMDKMGASTLPELIDMLIGLDIPAPQRQAS
ncbi:MAG TPA: response regulator [Limnohabitans sp.]|uniref:response regulator transcription factor n=1 Tax=Limnohabitans sp. TaxID=1907725 RepID=UPI0026AC3142|nr:response regulator [Limnohabitans sp.]HQS27402.1 response regulator [Limnohabitans sp.]